MKDHYIFSEEKTKYSIALLFQSGAIIRKITPKLSLRLSYQERCYLHTADLNYCNYTYCKYQQKQLTEIITE